MGCVAWSLGGLCLVSGCVVSSSEPGGEDGDSKGDDESRPVLGYTVASFASDQWRAEACADLLMTVSDQGFDVATFTPSYAYRGATDAHEALIDASEVPSWEDLRGCLSIAHDFGLQLAYKPHLDGGWRGEFDFDPSASSAYFDLLLRPAIDALAELRRSECPECALTVYISTELLRSTQRYAAGWGTLADQLRDAAREASVPITVTIDLLHDLPANVPSSEEHRRFFAKLDYLSLSQYTPLDVHGETVDGVVRTLEEYEANLRRYFDRMGLERDARVDFGEFGIGTDGLSAPYAYDGRERSEEETAIGIEGILRYLAARPRGSMGVANLWTVGKIYDVMGNHGVNGQPTEHGGDPSPVAKALIEAYNRGELP